MSPRETFFKRLSSEVGASLYLAVPVILGQSFSVAMNVVDTLLAGRHSALTLAAVGVGSAVWSLVLLILIGLLMVVPPFVAQLNGAGRRAEIGPLFERQFIYDSYANRVGKGTHRALDDIRDSVNELRYYRQRVFALDDRREMRDVERLDVRALHELGVRHDRGGIRVHEDHFVPEVSKCFGSLRSRVVELARLSDHDRSGANEKDLFDIVAGRHERALSTAPPVS